MRAPLGMAPLPNSASRALLCNTLPARRRFCFAKSTGALAQLGEHLLCKQGVIGSIPIRSTTVLFACELNVRDSDWRSQLRAVLPAKATRARTATFLD